MAGPISTWLASLFDNHRSDYGMDFYFRKLAEVDAAVRDQLKRGIASGQLTVDSEQVVTDQAEVETKVKALADALSNLCGQSGSTLTLASIEVLDRAIEKIRNDQL